MSVGYEFGTTEGRTSFKTCRKLRFQVELIGKASISHSEYNWQTASFIQDLLKGQDDNWALKFYRVILCNLREPQE